ncbi:hypothetical protein GCM10010365_72020 [Streptomyces poonensis]|uniref:Uncharacterized protein n=1 Tax=Streptomyces poonensis TaxID=68255 RepID=A0A918UXI4_9ACTN|nr:hypothetical protein GCM10010365_72020 [Streptomyces poonensis]GLJ91733.1 hypothetical protein GCM10017589_43400 [Streptomyces poonensis]
MRRWVGFVTRDDMVLPCPSVLVLGLPRAARLRGARGPAPILLRRAARDGALLPFRQIVARGPYDGRGSRPAAPGALVRPLAELVSLFRRHYSRHALVNGKSGVMPVRPSPL